MKRYSMWLKLAVLICVAAAIVSAPPSTLAYIATESNSVHNSFRVVYQPPKDIIVPVQIDKTMVNLSEQEIGPDGFDFELVNVDTGMVWEAKTSKDGLAEMQLGFGLEDVGRTYHYHLYEVNNRRKHVIYDDTVYNISIELSLNEINDISAKILMDDVPVNEIIAEFENKYYVPAVLPDTGDDSQPLLWAAMMLASGIGLVLLRKKNADCRRS